MMKGIISEHFNDEKGNPSGGTTKGTGIYITWQNGPLGRHVPGCIPAGPEGYPPASCAEGCTRKAPNGAFVEDVILAAKDRLEYYQKSKFSCLANSEAIILLGLALAALNRRTAEREERKVEGTHQK